MDATCAKALFERSSARLNVRFGSQADITPSLGHVCAAPESGHRNHQCETIRRASAAAIPTPMESACCSTVCRNAGMRNTPRSAPERRSQSHCDRASVRWLTGRAQLFRDNQLEDSPPDQARAACGIRFQTTRRSPRRGLGCLRSNAAGVLGSRSAYPFRE